LFSPCRNAQVCECGAKRLAKEQKTMKAKEKRPDRKNKKKEEDKEGKIKEKKGK
jgi:hypothetical protein